MFFMYQRVGRIPVLPAIAAAGGIVIVGGIAATILATVGVVACATRLLRALGLVATKRATASQGDDIIEGVVVNRSSTPMLDR